MKAIFDKNTRCVGWINEDSLMVFSTDMGWVGFIRDSYFFSSSLLWLGGLFDGSFVDRSGKPVAWVSGFRPKGRMPLFRPLKPLRPLTPLRPLRPLTPLSPLLPLTPLGGWSNLDWNEYISQQ